jgi:FMN phosphatase YigB (HAD superfamily)
MNGSRNTASRSDGKQKIRVFSCDWFLTLFNPPDGKSMAILTLRAAEHVLGKKLNIDAEAFADLLLRLRIDMALSDRRSVDLEHGSVEYWARVNAIAFRHFKHQCSLRQGRKITIMIRSDMPNYKVHPLQRKIVRRVIKHGFGGKGQSRVGRAFIISNTEARTLKRMLRNAEMSPLFDRIITPADLGGLHKGDQKFFGEMIKLTQIDPQTTVHIGNSPLRDGFAAREGIWTILIGCRVSPSDLAKLHGHGSLSRIFLATDLAHAERILNERFISVS